MKANKLTPNFEVKNIRETVAFYQNFLGFSLTMAVPETQDGIEQTLADGKEYVYALVGKDKVEMMFQRTDSFKEDVSLAKDISLGASVSFYMEIDGIEDFYGQIYMTKFAQDVNLVTGNRFVEDIKYYPHISFTGNVVGSLDTFKYYTGVIGGKTIKAYAGSDYTRKFGNLNISTGAIGYINPDRDYYSQIFSTVSQKIGFSKKNN